MPSTAESPNAQSTSPSGISHATHVRILLALSTTLAVAWGLFAWDDLSPYGLTDCQTARKMQAYNRQSLQSGAAPNAASESFIDSDVGTINAIGLRYATEWADGLGRYAEHIRGEKLRASADSWVVDARSLVGFLPELSPAVLDRKPQWWGDFTRTSEAVVEAPRSLSQQCPWWKP